MLGRGPVLGPRGWTGLEHSGAEDPSLPWGGSPGARGPRLVGHWTSTSPSGTGVLLRTDADGLSWELLLLLSLTHTETDTDTHKHRHAQIHTHRHT